MLNWILLAVMWIVGIFVYSMFTLQVILTFTVTIPLSNRCSKLLGEKFNHGLAIKMAMMTVVFQIIIHAIAAVLLFKFGNDYAKIGFAVGFGISFLFSLGKLSYRNPGNMQDFKDRTYARCFVGRPEESLF